MTWERCPRNITNEQRRLHRCQGLQSATVSISCRCWLSAAGTDGASAELMAVQLCMYCISTQRAFAFLGCLRQYNIKHSNK